MFLLFSEQQERFSTLTGVMESLFAMLIGKFDIGDTVALYRYNKIVSNVYNALAVNVCRTGVKRVKLVNVRYCAVFMLDK